MRRVLPQERLIRHQGTEEARPTKQTIHLGHLALDVCTVPAEAAERGLPGEGQ